MEHQESLPDLLKHVECFAALDAPSLALIESKMAIRSYEAGRRHLP